MLSSRGAITTNVALVECAAGQNSSDSNVFLLSELEKVWVAVAVVARRLLLDGSAVQIYPFGALWTREYVLLRDRQQKSYTTRKLCFGININYANRYGVDTSKVPLERPGGEGYVRVNMADIVAVCGVPARTASAALKEFFLYVGEGLSRGRVFQLLLPGVATISIKKQKVVLSAHDDLRLEMYEIDSRKWPGELQREGYEALQRQANTATSSALGSAAGSRPSSSHPSRASWCTAPASTADAAKAGDSTEIKRPVFVAASPSGRLFDDIFQQEEQRKKVAHTVALAERAMRRRQDDLDQRIERYNRHRSHADPVENGAYDSQAAVDHRFDDTCPMSMKGEEVGFDDGLRRAGLRPTSASGESVYNIINGSNPKNGAAIPRGVEATEEPEVEVIEIVDEPDAPEPSTAPAEIRPLAHKNAELERVLRQEEPFSRPLSRRAYHESSAARDLIYSQRYEEPSRGAGSAVTVGTPSVTRERNTTSLEFSKHTPTLTGTTRPGQGQEDVVRFGRKRFDENQYDSDHVGNLLQYHFEED